MIWNWIASRLPEAQTLLPLASIAGVALALVVLSFAVMARARSMVRRAELRVGEAEKNWQALFEACRKELTSQQEALDRQAAECALQTSPRPGINLSRRSQALRMHRKGDAPDQIAAALQIPRQEVELLVKVHQIVLSNL